MCVQEGRKQIQPLRGGGLNRLVRPLRATPGWVLLIAILLFHSRLTPCLAQQAAKSNGESPLPAQGRDQPQTPAPTDKSAKVEWKNGKVSVDVEGAPLSQVIQEVARKTGTGVIGLSALQGVVYVHFKDLDLAQAFQELLWEANYALINRMPSRLGNASGPALLVVFGGEGSELPLLSMDALASAGRKAERLPQAPPVPATEEAKTAQEKRLAAVAAASSSGDMGELLKALSDADPLVQAAALNALTQRDPSAATEALVKEAKSDKPLQRLQALQHLDQSGLADDATLLPLLHDAMSDSDPEVSSYAIRTLGDRGGSVAVDYLRQAFSSPDPATRLLVLEGIGDQPEGISLLQQALSDPDESVRASAAMWLQKQASDAQGH
jgi:HEAT repeat protein